MARRGPSPWRRISGARTLQRNGEVLPNGNTMLLAVARSGLPELPLQSRNDDVMQSLPDGPGTAPGYSLLAFIWIARIWLHGGYMKAKQQKGHCG